MPTLDCCSKRGDGLLLDALEGHGLAMSYRGREVKSPSFSQRPLPAVTPAAQASHRREAMASGIRGDAGVTAWADSLPRGHGRLHESQIGLF